ncbi:unnamed protein product [Peronospora destructor]|uniref:SREBP regulating gene protein n=1 Tax=Peronospora destructor TaxID=86335 RepID=A0AAV0V6W5_9STRA|nr:unnamed protein product [Peronospora destructor]
MLRGVYRTDDDDDDDESHKTDDKLLVESHERVSERRAQPGQHAQNTRWRLFMAAVMLVSQVFMELGRCGLQCFQRNASQYVVCIDRWLVQSICVSVCSGKKMGMLRLLLALGLAFVLPYIVLTIGRIHFPTGRGANVSVEDLDDEKIRSHIIVDEVDKPVPEVRQMFLREGGDRLKVDETKLRCDNTVQVVELLADSIGYVCTRPQLDRTKPGCCNETDATLPRIKQYTCDRCDTNPPHCCDVFEHCVSCCMHPLNSGTRREFLTHADPNHPVYSNPAAITVFQYCQYRCRTSSASVQRQNSYRSHPTASTMNGVVRLGRAHVDHLVPAKQLELDPYYHEYVLPD